MDDTLVSHLDLLPTICEITGVAPPADRKLDGGSWVPLFNQDGGNLIRTTPQFWFFYRVTPAAAMRDGDWVILGYLDDPIEKHTHPLSAPDVPMIKSAPLHRFELYNLKEDLSQEHDLSTKYPERLAELSKRMIAIHQEVVTEGPFWKFGED